MGARPADPRRIKLHRSYSIAEAADTLGVHQHTVENWLRQGLRPIDRRRPILIHGAECGSFCKSAVAAESPHVGQTSFTV